ncbi:MAG TPA: hypothetical protein VHO48_09590, partial [Anaerolineaceae bacterium]|nr:hypothetical protein [Anaerolineaceae bacterium]
MSTTTRRILISIAVLILASCVCLSLLAIAGVGAGYLQLNQPATSTPTPRPATPTPEARLDPTEASPAASTPAADLPAEVVQQMETIQDQVVELRGLPAERDVPRFLLGPEQLRQRVMDDFFKDYTAEDAQDDATVLSALGLIPEDYDLLSLYIDLYSESVAGFYDQDEQVMYIVQDDNFQGSERLTYSHEYTHALQDQAYDFKDGLGFTDEACEGQSERCAGLQALIEGDASMIEQRWLMEFSTEQDMKDLQAELSGASTQVYDSAPAYVQQDMLFPYLKGLEFIESLYDRGGIQAVNAAYQAPPVSTEQILHPDLYPTEEPETVTLPDLSAALGSDWQSLDEETLGEWYTFLVLTSGSEEKFRLSEADGRAAAAGWDGDRYAVYLRESDQAAALVLETLWDDAQQADEFVKLFSDYGDQRWGASRETSGQR